MRVRYAYWSYSRGFSHKKDKLDRQAVVNGFNRNLWSYQYNHTRQVKKHKDEANEKTLSDKEAFTRLEFSMISELQRQINIYLTFLEQLVKDFNNLKFDSKGNLIEIPGNRRRLDYRKENKILFYTI